MELDDLKQSWKRPDQGEPPFRTDIGRLLGKERGPAARLKRTFRRRMIVLPLTMTFLMLQLSRHHDIFSDLMFWIYVAICLGMICFFYASYRVVDRMQQMDGQVKATLQRQVSLLQKMLYWRLLIARCCFVLFILLFELMLYLHQEPSLVKWYHHPLWLRVLAYAAGIAVFYGFSGWMIRFQYQRHIDRLKTVVEEME